MQSRRQLDKGRRHFEYCWEPPRIIKHMDVTTHKKNSQVSSNMETQLYTRKSYFKTYKHRYCCSVTIGQYLVILLVFVFMSTVPTKGQFPAICAKNATLENATCCPTPPGKFCVILLYHVYSGEEINHAICVYEKWTLGTPLLNDCRSCLTEM